MRFCVHTTLCLLMILIAAKGIGMAQFSYQKCEKAVSLPNISKNIFDVSKVVGEGGGVSRETQNGRFLLAKSICKVFLTET